MAALHAYDALTGAGRTPLWWTPLRTLGPALVRKAGVPVTLRRTDTGSRALLRPGRDGATVVGLPSEMVLFCYGRAQCHVELTGNEGAIAALQAADKGL